MFRWLNIALIQLLWLCPLSQAGIALPTPREHYKNFKLDPAGLVLLLSFAREMDPAAQRALLNLAQAAGAPMSGEPSSLGPPTEQKPPKPLEATELLGGVPTQKEQLLASLKKANWDRGRPQLLELLVHQSQVLGVIPKQWDDIWVPIVHDALLYFLDHLPEGRLLEKLANLACLPPGSPRGEYLVQFVDKTPSLQKLGQILARNPGVPTDLRTALQQLENGMHTMPREELVQFIIQDVGKDVIEKYQVTFAERPLAEASVGAVIRATLVPPGTSAPREAVCKVIKPYVLTYLPQDLAIIDGLVTYFTQQHDFYEIGSTPLVPMFRDIRDALADEIKIPEEQHNLARAREYYRNERKILVPELFPLCTPHATFMEYVSGEKISAAFPGNAQKRATMARRFSDALTFEVIFSPKAEAFFHGDPHAGNVFHVLNESQDPYRIALLDWGLCGILQRAERLNLVQLMLGVQLGDAKRLRNNIAALLQDGLPKSPEQLRGIDAVIHQTLSAKGQRSSFDAVEELLKGLIKEGHATKFNLNLFIKAQITIAGILEELDPTLKQDEYLEQRVRGLIKREFPKRLLNTVWFPAWNSRNYRSMLSNQDVLVKLFKKSKTADKRPQTPLRATMDTGPNSTSQ